MDIHAVGISYRRTPVDLRERLSFSEKETHLLLERICDVAGIRGCVIVSTCNRTEVYVDAPRSTDTSAVEDAICRVKGVDPSMAKKHFYNLKDRRAVNHLFRMASGLDSMIYGEDHILGQVKGALRISQETGCSTPVLNTLFKKAVTAAKSVKTNTELSRCPVSVGTIAIKAVEGQFGGSLAGLSALVIGSSGEIGSSIVRGLAQKGLARVYASLRTRNGEGIHAQLPPNVVAVRYEDRYACLDECDIIVSATSSPHYTLTGDLVSSAVKAEKKRVFVDLAVPRDMDASISALDGARCFNIDDLTAISDDNRAKRIEAGEHASCMLEEYMDEFEKWLIFRSGNHLIDMIDAHYEKSSEGADGILGRRNETPIRKLMYDIRDRATPKELEGLFRCLGDIVGENGG